MAELGTQAEQIWAEFLKSKKNHLVILGESYHADRIIQRLRSVVGEGILVYSGNQLGLRSGVNENIPENFLAVYVDGNKRTYSIGSTNNARREAVCH